MEIAFVGDSLTAGMPGSSYFAILRERLPEHRLVNLGRGNDTVISLYRRIAQLRLDDTPRACSFDIALLWVGVNDSSGEGSRSLRIINALRRQSRPRSLDEFRAAYRKTLDLLCRHAGRVIAVAPLLKGEDVNSKENHRVEDFAKAIEELAAEYERVEYLDLRPIFFQALTDRHISDYIMEGPLHIGLDVLLLRGDAQVDRKSAERGLHLTLDGVHLNSAGAKLVAEAFLRVISSSD